MKITQLSFTALFFIPLATSVRHEPHRAPTIEELFSDISSDSASMLESIEDLIKEAAKYDSIDAARPSPITNNLKH